MQWNRNCLIIIDNILHRIWCKEHLWDFCVLERLHLSILLLSSSPLAICFIPFIITTTTTIITLYYLIVFYSVSIWIPTRIIRDYSAFVANHSFKVSPSTRCVSDAGAVCKNMDIFNKDCISLTNFVTLFLLRFSVIFFVHILLVILYILLHSFPNIMSWHFMPFVYYIICSCTAVFSAVL
jgi:hypothetical protein